MAQNKVEEDKLITEETIQVKSDFLSMKEPVRKSARLSSALLNYKRPEGINLVPIGSSWALDIFARLHNGARREMIDLYNMIDCMQKKVEDLRSSHLKLFIDWWHVFSSYLKVCFRSHEDVLMPWAFKDVTAPEAVSDTKRGEIKKVVLSIFRNFDTIDEQLSRRPPDESMAKIIKGLSDIHPVVEYFEAIENNVPDLLEQKYTLKDGKKVEKRLASYLHNTGSADVRRMHLVIMTRAMHDDVVSAWQKTIPPLVRISYKSSNKRLSATHLAIVDKLARE